MVLVREDTYERMLCMAADLGSGIKPQSGNSFSTKVLPVCMLFIMVC